MPRPPLVRFAPRQSGSFRILHRLDAVDSLIYTALVHEIMVARAKPEGADSAGAIRTRRLEPAAEGSFFGSPGSAWHHHVDWLETLAQKYRVLGPQNTGGYVLMTDIYDFFGHIQPRRLVQFLLERRAMRPERLNALGRFLPAFCTGAGRGLPAGPSASTVLSEVILSVIDHRIHEGGHEFARWGDDYRIFCTSPEDAEKTLDDLSSHLQTAHEMFIAPQKTRIVNVGEFLSRHFRRQPQESADAGAAEERLNRYIGESVHPTFYAWMTASMPASQAASVYAGMRKLPEFRTVTSAYLAHFDRAVGVRNPDLIAARRILRKATVYRIPDLIPPVLAHFEKLSPVIREAALYLHAVLDHEKVITFEQEIREAWEKKVHASTYISEWMSYLFTNPCFNEINLPTQYGDIPDARGKALIALRKKDADWVKRQSAHLESLDYWDRRAVLYACSLLAPEERARITKMRHRGITERMIVRYLQKLDGMVAGTGSSGGYGVSDPDEGASQDKPHGDQVTGPGAGGGYAEDGPGLGGGYKPASAIKIPKAGAPGAKGPDNYPSYGDQVAGPGSTGGYGASDSTADSEHKEVMGPGAGGGYGDAAGAGAVEDKSPDNYPSYGNKIAGPGSTGGYGATEPDADSGQKEVAGPGAGGGYGDAAGAGAVDDKSPDNYPSYGNKIAGPGSTGGYGATEPDADSGQKEVMGPGSGGGYGEAAGAGAVDDKSPDNYPSYGNKVAGTGSSGGYGASSPDDDAGNNGSASR